MKCPKCQTDLIISDRQGIEIDSVHKCRGVWLDRGELDKLIERASRYVDGRCRSGHDVGRADRAPNARRGRIPRRDDEEVRA
jgi:Zn-finger nucleic acid-binding protein